MEKNEDQKKVHLLLLWSMQSYPYTRYYTYYVTFLFDFDVYEILYECPPNTLPTISNIFRTIEGEIRVRSDSIFIIDLYGDGTRITCPADTVVWPDSYITRVV